MNSATWPGGGLGRPATTEDLNGKAPNERGARGNGPRAHEKERFTMSTETKIAEQDALRHRAVSETGCACGWEVDGFTAPELVEWKRDSHIKSANDAESARLSDEQVQEILDQLNGFVDRGPDGTDYNVTEAVAWANEQDEVFVAYDLNAEGEALVELVDGTVLEWEPARAQWTVTVSDDAEAVQP